jgi:hypothetical protein
MAKEPDIILGLPGQWPTRSDIPSSIARLTDGLLVAGKVLLDTTANQSYQLDIYEHDPDLVRPDRGGVATHVQAVGPCEHRPPLLLRSCEKNTYRSTS